MASKKASNAPDASNTTSTNARLCANCRQPSVQRCSSCHVVWYCSKECQKANWPLHKWFCSLPYPEKDVGKRSVRAVLLPADSPTPQFVEVPYVDYKDGPDPDHIVSVPNLRAFLDKHNSRRMLIFPSTGVIDGAKTHTLTVWCRDNFLNDGSEPNQCVAAITEGKNTTRWRGPLLAFESPIFEGGEFTNVFGQTVNPCVADPEFTDFRKAHCGYIIDFFLEERNMTFDSSGISATECKTM